MPDQITDDVLMNAIRQRLLDEIMRKQQTQTHIQNIIGGAGVAPGGEAASAGGVFEGLRAPPPEADMGMEEPMDYGVDIERSKMWANPKAGQEGQDPFLPPGIKPQVDAWEGGVEPDPIGWRKSVRRFRSPRGQEIERKKKL